MGNVKRDENFQKEPKGTPYLQLKIDWLGINSTMNTTHEIISELEDRSMDIMQTERGIKDEKKKNRASIICGRESRNLTYM